MMSVSEHLAPTGIAQCSKPLLLFEKATYR
jgi:hypothetical protein